MFLTTDMFVDAIMLIVHSPSAITKAMVKDLVAICEEELHAGTPMQEPLIRFYIALLKELLYTDIKLLDSELELKTILLKFRTNPAVLANVDVYEGLQSIFSSKERLGEARINELMANVRNNVLWYNSSRNVKKMFGKLNNFTNTTDRGKKDELLSDLQQLTNELNQVFSSSSCSYNKPVDKIDFSDKLAIRQALKSYQTRKVNNIFKLGLQGINRLFGHNLGYSLGESVVFNALSHHFKSSMLMNIARWTIQYNTPMDIGDGIPTILFISLENETAENMMTLYTDAYVAISQTSAEGKSDEEIIDFIHEFFNMNGWKLIIERRLGQAFGADELQALFKEYKAAGHKILCTIIDYMNMMKKKDVNGMGNHLQLRELYTNTVNFLKHENSALFTAHQLNRDAAKIAASGVTNIVEKFGIGYLADGMDPQREVDVVIFLHIEKNNFGIPYLTARIDKHRYVNDTPEAWKRTAYRFGPFGIQDDVAGRDMSVKDIYADVYVPEQGPLLNEKDIPKENIPPLDVGETVSFGDEEVA